MKSVILIAHDIRSIHNVGSLLRTADGLGVDTVYLTGYTPYPKQPQDTRLPHQTARIMKQLHKTALGAETNKNVMHVTSVSELLRRLKSQGYRPVALEQAAQSVELSRYQSANKTALLIGREVEGIEPELLAQMDDIVEIPMHGKKESLNVVQATAIALYQLLLPES